MKYIDYHTPAQIINGTNAYISAPYALQYTFGGIMPNPGWFNQSINIGAIQGVGFAGTFFGIASGTGDTQREGRNVTIKSMLFNLVLSGVCFSGPTGGDVLRISIIQDSQFNGTVPAIGEVYGTVVGGQVTVNYLDLPNVETSNRFKILCDECVELTNPFNTGIDEATGGLINVPWKKYLKVDIPLSYANTANNGSTATITGNNVFMIVRSRNGGAYIEGKVRCRYTDK